MINECPSCSTIGAEQDTLEAGYKLSHGLYRLSS